MKNKLSLTTEQIRRSLLVTTNSVLFIKAGWNTKAWKESTGVVQSARAIRLLR